MRFPSEDPKEIHVDGSTRLKIKRCKYKKNEKTSKIEEEKEGQQTETEKENARIKGKRKKEKEKILKALGSTTEWVE